MMYVFGCGALGVLGFLYLLAKRKGATSERKGIMGCFDCIAIYLLKRPKIRKWWTRGSPQITRELSFLHPGEAAGMMYFSYLVNKISLILLIVTLAIVIGMLAQISQEETISFQVIDSNQESELLANPEIENIAVTSSEENDTTCSPQIQIERGKPGETGKEYELLVTVDGEKTEKIKIPVASRIYSEAELEQLLFPFSEQLEKHVLDENDSFLEVKGNLNLVTQVENYPFAIRWYVSDPALMTDKGILTDEGLFALEEREEIELVITAYVSYLNWEKELVYSVRLVSNENWEDDYSHKLSRVIARLEQNSRTEDALVLPTSLDGKNVIWRENKQKIAPIVWMGGLIIALMIFFLSDRDLITEANERRSEMKRAYPEFLQKFALYMGAGMTSKGVFFKLAKEYTDQRNQTMQSVKTRSRNQKQVNKSRALDEEILLLCGEMRSGVSEMQAYEHFGRRIGLQEFIRFGTMLQQNMKKGSENMLVRLLEETKMAQAEKYRECRKVGEEATTKMLLPMVLMLLVVMIIVMMPAFFSMQI